MAFLKKEIVKYGTAAHITMPKHMVGQAVIVVTSDEISRFEELVRNAYVLSRFSDSESTGIERKLNELKDATLPRIALLERTVASLTGRIEPKTAIASGTIV